MLVVMMNREIKKMKNKKAGIVIIKKKKVDKYKNKKNGLLKKLKAMRTIHL